MPASAFKPTVHGFHFVNQFASDVIMNEMYDVPTWMFPDMSWGLCGGMCFAALDRYFRREPVPDTKTTPGKGDDLFHELVMRQMKAVAQVGMNNILDYQARPDEGHWYNPRHSIGHLTLTEQWPGVRSKIDAGIPTTICLIRAEPWDPRIGNNHQVVVYDYSIDGGLVRLHVYDPNIPDNDTVVVGFRTDGHNSALHAYQEPGQDPRGFLRVPYDRQEVAIPLAAPGQAFAVEQLEWIWTVFS
jgi:hypothetical protein